MTIYNILRADPNNWQLRGVWFTAKGGRLESVLGVQLVRRHESGDLRDGACVFCFNIDLCD